MKSKKFHLQQLQNEILKTEIDSIEKTSSQISREIHDNIVSHLCAACILLQEEPISSEQITLIHGIVDGSVDQLRGFSRSLTAHHVGSIKLDDAIENEIKLYRGLNKHHFDFKYDLSFDQVPKDDQLMLLRICQEALTNAIKHSDATNIAITFTREDNRLKLKIKDNGKGFETEEKMKESNGLLNMRKRAEYIHADLDIISSKNSGTEITVEL